MQVLKARVECARVDCGFKPKRHRRVAKRCGEIYTGKLGSACVEQYITSRKQSALRSRRGTIPITNPSLSVGLKQPCVMTLAYSKIPVPARFSREVVPCLDMLPQLGLNPVESLRSILSSLEDTLGQGPHVCLVANQHNSTDPCGGFANPDDG